MLTSSGLLGNGKQLMKACPRRLWRVRRMAGTLRIGEKRLKALPAACETGSNYLRRKAKRARSSSLQRGPQHRYDVLFAHGRTAEQSALVVMNHKGGVLGVLFKKLFADTDIR